MVLDRPKSAIFTCLRSHIKVIFSLLQLNLLRNRIKMDKVSFWGMLGLRSKQIGIQQEIFRFEVSMRHLIDRNRSMMMGI